VDLRGKTVLLVDDEPLGREAMRCELGDWGMNVVLAADAEEALHYLTARQIELDVAIVDRDLGSHISGPELLDRLATTLGVAVPAIVITGATDSDTLHELEETGYTYLIKPVDEVTLRRALNEVMSQTAEAS
jgi:DNA-binding NtrC family response regulator